MCRLAAYIGPARPVADLLYTPSHSLENQAYRPREMVFGTINVDGTGLVWWPEHEDAPLRYVTTAAPWADANLPRLAPRLTGRTIVATVRSATRGIPTDVGTVLPFELDGVAGTHNGFLRRFRETTAARCLATLPEDLVGEFEALSDSRAVFLLAIAARREDPDLSLADALVGAVGTAARICADVGADCSLNVMLATADEVVAIRCARGVEPNSLYYRDALEEGQGAWIASEALDDEPGWEPVAPDHLVRLRRDSVSILPVRIEH